MDIEAPRRRPFHGGSRSPSQFVIAVNPDAGGARKRLVGEIAKRLEARGRVVRVEHATDAGHIRHLAQTTAADAVLVAGGDGSINEAVRGLLERANPRPSLGVIPQGTVNVLARELALPHDSEALAALFARGETKPLHVGLANGRPFVLMASAGLDAAVVEAADLALKKRIGRMAYAVAAARLLSRNDGPDIVAETDAGSLPAKCVVVAKSKFYGGRFVIDAEAGVTRPGLSLVALTEASPRAYVALARYFATGRLDPQGYIRKLVVKRVRLLGADAPTQIDGDYLGRTPLDICEADASLDIFA